MRNEFRIPFFLIWRFLRRGNKWTLLLTIFLMSVAFINLIFMNSLFHGIVQTSDKQVIQTSAGDVTVSPLPGRDYIDGVSSRLAAIDRLPGVRAASPQTLVPGSLKFRNAQGNYGIYAVDPALDSKTLIISKKMSHGSYLSPGDKDKIIIGRQVAGGGKVELNSTSLKGARVGDKVILSTNAFSKVFTVKGIYFTKSMQADNNAYITTSALDQLLPQMSDRATRILVRTNTPQDENRVLREIRNADLGVAASPWQDSAGVAKSVTSSFITINALLTTVGFLIAAVVIFIIIYVEINHRRQEIGILRAIGIKSYLIRTTYVFQAIVYSVLGVALGTAIFFGLIVPYFSVHPFAIPIGDVKLIANAADFNARAWSVILVAIVSATIPSILVTRAKILDEIAGR